MVWGCSVVCMDSSYAGASCKYEVHQWVALCGVTLKSRRLVFCGGRSVILAGFGLNECMHVGGGFLL